MIQFVRNYNDLSTERGFQFEFYCDRCGSGYQTEFQNASTGTFDLLEAAGNMLGGVFGEVASLSENARSAAWEKAHDDAFRKAVDMAKTSFQQCGRCGQWADKICWNTANNLCKECAPDLNDETSVTETQAAIRKVEENAESVSTPKKKKSKSISTKICPKCQAQVSGKFCGECGTAIQKDSNCTSCGAEVSGKFCAECGAKQ